MSFMKRALVMAENCARRWYQRLSHWKDRWWIMLSSACFGRLNLSSFSTYVFAAFRMTNDKIKRAAKKSKPKKKLFRTRIMHTQPFQRWIKWKRLLHTKKIFHVEFKISQNFCFSDSSHTGHGTYQRQRRKNVFAHCCWTGRNRCLQTNCFDCRQSNNSSNR